MSNPLQHITTKALFYKDNKILFVKDTKGKWEMPSGKIELGETPEQAIKRELKEELGFNNVEIGNIINVWVFNTHFHEKDHQYYILVYECFRTFKKSFINKKFDLSIWNKQKLLFYCAK